MAQRGMIFDFDGTLADTIPVCCAAFREVVRGHTGREMTDAEIMALFGPSEEGILRAVVGSGWERSHEDYLVAYERAHAACPAAFDGMAEVLATLRDGGVALGLVTGKGARSVEISLRLLDLASWFDAVEAGSPDGPVKPAALRRIVARWQLDPADVAYVGDAPSDMRDARDAGLIPLAAAWASTADAAALVREQPAAVLCSVAELQQWVTNHDR